MEQNLKEQATNENTPPEYLKFIVKQSTELARLVAKNSSAEPELLRELALSQDQPTREGVTTNPNTPTEILLTLAQEFPKEFISNPNTPANVLENFVKDWHCISLIAQNPSTPANALEQLEGFFGFEWFLVRHPNTPIKMLERLLKGFAKSHINLDRLYVVHHPFTPLEIIEELAKDRDSDVREAAVQALKKHKL